MQMKNCYILTSGVAVQIASLPERRVPTTRGAIPYHRGNSEHVCVHPGPSDSRPQATGSHLHMLAGRAKRGPQDNAHRTWVCTLIEHGYVRS